MKIAARLLLGLTIAFGSEISLAHLRVSNPTGGRDLPTTDFQKFTRPNAASADSPSPCGPSTTPNSPRLSYTPGATVRFDWVETIDHPGSYIIQFSPNNLQGFWDANNQLANVPDPNRNNPAVGSPWTRTVTLPTTPCENCALRILQEMTDQPGEYYVHCYDIRIATAGSTPPPTTPPGGGENTKASEGGNSTPRMGGCGTIDGGSSGPGGPLALLSALFLLWTALRFRPQLVRRKVQ